MVVSGRVIDVTIHSRDLRYPTLGKGKGTSSSNMPWVAICWFPGGYPYHHLHLLTYQLAKQTKRKRQKTNSNCPLSLLSHAPEYLPGYHSAPFPESPHEKFVSGWSGWQGDLIIICGSYIKRCLSYTVETPPKMNMESGISFFRGPPVKFHASFFLGASVVGRKSCIYVWCKSNQQIVG